MWRLLHSIRVFAISSSESSVSSIQREACRFRSIFRGDLPSRSKGLKMPQVIHCCICGYGASAVVAGISVWSDFDQCNYRRNGERYFWRCYRQRRGYPRLPARLFMCWTMLDSDCVSELPSVLLYSVDNTALSPLGGLIVRQLTIPRVTFPPSNHRLI